MDHILCIDDDPDTLEAIRLNLVSRDDVEVHAFEDPVQALESIEALPDLSMALVDIKMPGLSGIEFLSKLREKSPQTVRVNMSSHADLDVVLEALGSNQIFDFIRKPLQRQDLLAVIHKGLGTYRLKKERDALAESLVEKNHELERWNARLDEEVQKKTLELRLRDRLMQHLSGYISLDNPFKLVDQFLENFAQGSSHGIYATEGDQLRRVASEGEHWPDKLSIHEVEEALQLSRRFELKHHGVLLGHWFIRGAPPLVAHGEVLPHLAPLVGLLLYDELTLCRLGELESKNLLEG